MRKIMKYRDDENIATSRMINEKHKEIYIEMMKILQQAE
jgi:hypothetical protein